jgi:hypothetical protein
VSCTSPFPWQTPAVQVAHPCVQCPNADRTILDRHAAIARDDAELLEALRSFARWILAEDAREYQVEETIRYATDLYTRPDHTGTCIPKTILFACYKAQQFTGEPMKLSEAARDALKGLPVPSWPDGSTRSGRTWNELFKDYSRRYD